jgi:2,3-bisphosphoglycerate-dependent phosphoglycerate mutase
MRLIIGIFILLIIGCKPTDIDVNGKYVSSIERNTITFEGGHNLELDNANGTKTIFLVRHAEKDTIPKDNPILTDAGYERSYRLAEMFKKTRLDAIYSTLYNRTLHTVDSLSTLKGLKTMIYQPKDLKQIGADITSSKEVNKVIVAGHSNTTPALANVFMGEKIIDAGFDESDYDNILIVQITAAGQKTLYQLRYK